MPIPRFISVDDHVLEPGDLWQRYLPERFRSQAPRLQRLRGRFEGGARGQWTPDDSGHWGDIWVFEGLQMPIIPGFAAAGMDQDYLGERRAPQRPGRPAWHAWAAPERGHLRVHAQPPSLSLMRA